MSRSTTRLLVVAGLTAALLSTGLPAAVAAEPTLTGLAPTSARPGGTVTLTGTDLDGATAVAIGSTPAAFAVVDASRVTATVPAGATTGAVSVTTPDGTATGPVLTVVPPPATPSLTARPGSGLVELRWTGGGTAGVLLRALAGTVAPASPTEGRAVAASGGLAVDRGLANGAPVTYALWAVDSDGTRSADPATVTATPVAPRPTTLRLSTSTTLLAAGARLSVSGRLFATGTGAAVAGAPVEVLARQGGTTTVRVIATVRTRADGLALHGLVPRTSAEYSLRYRGDPFSAAAVSPKVVVRVQPRVSARFVPDAVLRGQAATVSGAVYPAYAGVRVVLQRRTSTGWASVLGMKTSSDGRFSGRLVPSTTASYRALLVRGAAYEPAGSPAIGLRVDPRDLRLGMRGPDVLAVERALWTQGKADVGPVDGVFDADTLHGVIAFQKSQGLPRTGVFSSTTRYRLGSTTPRGARYPVAGRSVEISLSQQVLRVFEGGRLARLVDVSTGNNALYTSGGKTYRAYTPTGRFSILRKIDGIRISHLGELYRPAYFYGGWAVHGSKSVPTYPASHGCVRVTNRQMDRLFPLLRLGTPLAVYS